MSFDADSKFGHRPLESLLGNPAAAAAGLDAGEEHDGALRFRTIWISDVHLGAAGCQAAPLLDFLRHTESNRLYLVGNIIDGCQLARRWFWPQSHNDVIQKLLRKARKGTAVVYIPGNHDQFGRRFLPVSFGGIEVRHDDIHITADGRRLLVTHGDLFAGIDRRARRRPLLGHFAGLAPLRLGRWLTAARALLGLPWWSLSQRVPHRVGSAPGCSTDFEVAVAAEADLRTVDGVVCGHTRRAEIRSIRGTLYCNCGDWVESLTALVEDDHGRLSILRWKDSAQPTHGAIARVTTAKKEPDAYSACH